MKKHIIWCDTAFMTAEELERWARDIRANCEENPGRELAENARNGAGIKQY